MLCMCVYCLWTRADLSVQSCNCFGTQWGGEDCSENWNDYELWYSIWQGTDFICGQRNSRPMLSRFSFLYRLDFGTAIDLAHCRGFSTERVRVALEISTKA